MARLMVIISDEMYEVVRRRAFEERTSLGAQIRLTLTAYLGKTPKSTRKEVKHSSKKKATG